ncbi:MAG: ABC transporter permease [Finegoldia sp.]|nr:ABC transporter permease [Finegoldia sp.]
MKKYLFKRFLTGIFTIFAALSITFFLSRVAGGNPILAIAGRDNTNPAQLEYLTEKYGLDKSYPVQYILYIKSVLTGDLGTSIKFNRPVWDIIKEKIPATLLLALTSSLLSIIIGTYLGVRSARKKGNFFDKFLLNLSYIIDSIPVFWLALMMIVIFATKLGFLPTSGMFSARESHEGFAKFIDLLKHMVLPVLTIVIVRIPFYFRISRNSTIKVMEENFVKILSATGMDSKILYGKYILKNSLIPLITSFTMSLAGVIGGVAMVEIVFAWPGMGRVLLDAISSRDYPVISGLYLIISISVTLFMLLADLIYVYVDPRIKLND